MILTEFLPAKPHPLWQLSKQIGVTHAIVKAAPELTGLNPPWDLGALRSVQKELEEEGITLYGLEGDEFDMSRIKLGLPGRDDDIEKYRQMLRNMGELGIPLLCYNFMARSGWARNAMESPSRGGARATGFRLSEAAAGEGEPVSPEKIWENYAYFIRAVIPEAEKAGVKMGLHPDDPPLPALGNTGRIFNTPEAFERALSLVSSPAHGVTFCQANFKLMGADPEHWIRTWGKRDKIHFAHVRDVRGTAEDFVETFHDDGPTDMPRLFQAYHEAGFHGPLRCDHVPTMYGEEPEVPGYGTLGRLFAIGYFKGILDTLNIPYR